jgi:tripartite-type tricarboxylate transporter receptor subunit TctC
MAAAVLLMAAGIDGAQAEDYPARTVTIIVPFAAGGPADITGRIVADIFDHHLGQKFVVENAGGAGGTVGTLRAARRRALRATAQPSANFLLWVKADPKRRTFDVRVSVNSGPSSTQRSPPLCAITAHSGMPAIR